MPKRRCHADRGGNLELEAWLDLVRSAYERDEHVDLVVFGDESDLTSYWSGCPATSDRSVFLSALVESIAEMEADDDDVGGSVPH